MKKKSHQSTSLILILFWVFIAQCILPVTDSLAQAPQAFNYQAVARSAGGSLLVNQAATIQYTVRDVSAAGAILYQERHNITTNQFGLFTASVGNGTVVAGTFSSINWSANPKYLQVEIDLGGGFVDMGTSQLLSVPYALNSLSTSGISGATGFVPKFITSNTLGNSVISENLGLVGIGTVIGTGILSIEDNGAFSYGLYVHKTGGVENAYFVKDNPTSSTANVYMTYNNSNGFPTLESHATDYGIAGSFSAEANSIGIEVTANGVGTAARIFAYGSGNALVVNSNNGVPTGSFIQGGAGAAGYFDSPNGYGIIVNSGRIGIGTQTPGYTVDIQDATTSLVSLNINNTGSGYCLQAITSGGADAIYAQCNLFNGTGIYSVCDPGSNAWGVAGNSSDGIGGRFSTSTGYAGFFNGDIGGTGIFSYTSDRKLKKNIEPLTGALNKIMQLKPSTYEYRVGEFGSMTLSKGKHFGVIAQDLQQVFPELVKQENYSGMKDPKSGKVGESVDYLGVNYNELIPILIKGMQEQQSTINSLKEEIELLRLQVKK